MNYYSLLRAKATKAIIKNSYTNNGAVGTVKKLVEMGYDIVSVFTIADSIGVDPIIGPVGSIVISISKGALDIMFESFYENIDSIADIMAALTSYGGAGYNMVEGADIYYANHGICITYRGFSLNGYTDFSNLYSTYDSTTIEGVIYETGH